MCAYIVPLYGNIPAHGSIQLPFSWSLELRTNTSSDSGWLKRTNTSCNIANKIFCDHPDFREVPRYRELSCCPLQIKAALHPAGGGCGWVKAQWNVLHSVLDCSLLDVHLVALDFCSAVFQITYEVFHPITVVFSSSVSTGDTEEEKNLLAHHFTADFTS